MSTLSANHKGSSATEGESSPTVDTRVHCLECDYNLTGATERCPWCGWVIDADALKARQRSSLRVLVAVGAMVAAAASGLALFLLLDLGTGLRWRDAAILVSVLLAVAGHLALAFFALTSRLWPMRRGEVSAILLAVALASVTIGVTGASQTLGLAPTPLYTPAGVQVNGIFEFALSAAFFSLPGLSLLALRLVAYRPRVRLPSHNMSPREAPAEEQAPYAVDWQGVLTREQVAAAWIETPRPSTPDVDRLIEETWQSAEQQARAKGRLLYNGPLVRLIDIEDSGDRLRLNVGPTCYRDFVGTHFHNAAVVRATAPEAFAQALGISVLPLTRDGQLILGRRSPKVVWHGGWIHPYGGMAEPSDRAGGGAIDVFASARRELCEELGVPADHVSGLTLIALARDVDLYQPELIFDAALPQSAREISARFAAHGDGEHDALEFIGDDPETVAGYLQSAARLTPIAQAALLLHGRQHFGAEWYAQTCLLCYGAVPTAPRANA